MFIGVFYGIFDWNSIYTCYLISSGGCGFLIVTYIVYLYFLEGDVFLIMICVLIHVSDFAVLNFRVGDYFLMVIFL